MRLPDPGRREQGENLVPLINIVFLLLIFFMLAGTFTQPELFRVEPPRSLSETQPADEALAVLLSADGRLALEGDAVADAQLVVVLAQRLKDPQAPPVQLKADGQVRSQRLLEVMDLLREAGVEKIRLVTVRGG
jgi:biopolymer transport protein ExbD